MTRQALIQSTAIAGLVLLLLWPPLTWWLLRSLRRRRADLLHGPDAAGVRRRVSLLGALWAVLPAAFAFVFWLLVPR